MPNLRATRKLTPKMLLPHNRISKNKENHEALLILFILKTRSFYYNDQDFAKYILLVLSIYICLPFYLMAHYDAIAEAQRAVQKLRCEVKLFLKK